MVLESLNKECVKILNKYLKVFGQVFAGLIKIDPSELEAKITISFIDNMLKEILMILKLIDQEELVRNNLGLIFTICAELSKFDEIANQVSLERDSHYFEILQNQLKIWFINL